MYAVRRVYPPVNDIQVVRVKVKLHAVYCCVEVAEYLSELLPVVLVWISHLVVRNAIVGFMSGHARLLRNISFAKTS